MSFLILLPPPPAPPPPPHTLPSPEMENQRVYHFVQGSSAPIQFQMAKYASPCVYPLDFSLLPSRTAAPSLVPPLPPPRVCLLSPPPWRGSIGRGVKMIHAFLFYPRQSEHPVRTMSLLESVDRETETQLHSRLAPPPPPTTTTTLVCKTSQSWHRGPASLSLGA